MVSILFRETNVMQRNDITNLRERERGGGGQRSQKVAIPNESQNINFVK